MMILRIDILMLDLIIFGINRRRRWNLWCKKPVRWQIVCARMQELVQRVHDLGKMFAFAKNVRNAVNTILILSGDFLIHLNKKQHY